MVAATKFRSLDVNGDWTFGLGAQGYAQNVQALKYDLQTRLRSWMGDCFFDLQMGIDWKNLLGNFSSQNNLLFALRTLILSTQGVMSINSLDIVNDPIGRDLSLTYNVDTVYQSNVSSDFSLFSSNNNVVTGYTITTYIPLDASAGPLTVTAPIALGIGGTELVYKKIDATANAVTLVPSLGETFDGQTSYTMYAQNEVVRLMSNNVDWEISGKL